jgi:hypothetical protein
MNRYEAESFLDNINKLNMNGTKKAYSKDKSICVTIARNADHSRGVCKRLNRTGMGTRRFRVAGGEDYGLWQKSPSGKSYSEYTLGQIREALMA